MIVIDASVWIGALLPIDVNHQSSNRWVNNHISKNIPHYLPTLGLAEVAGSIARRNNSSSEGINALNYIIGLNSIRLIDVDRSLGELAARLASNLRLKGADSVYVAVALQLNIPLLTWDKELLNRANAVIPVQTP
jgi:predicted nucleic acid-binding protein